ncbi:MAG TPA: hypothetical protein VII83_05040 [Gaiellaceae bacterium]|jgi:hypothetical protein
MTVLIRIAAGLFLIAHGLVHLLYLMPEKDDPSFPFTLKESWLVPEAARRPTGLVLMGATVTAFALLGLAVWGVPGLAGAWPLIGIIAAGLSIVLLVAFWNSRLSFGICIDLALIALAVTRPEWIEKFVG